MPWFASRLREHVVVSGAMLMTAILFGIYPAMQTPLASLPRAALWMSGWLFLMLVITVAGREAMRELNVFQVMELRALIGFVLLWPLVHAAGGLRAMGTARLGQHVLRNMVHYAAQYCWLAALLLIPLAQVVAIEFTMPIWSALLAVALLGERMDRTRWIAIAFGLAGVVAIVRPSVSHPKRCNCWAHC